VFKDADANVQDADEETLPKKARFWGNSEVVKLLLEATAAETVTNSEGKTAMTIAPDP
jgi:ankyrin repeat protein